MDMPINFEDAEFLAGFFDAVERQAEKQMANIDDFVTAQSFLGNDFGGNPEDIRDAFDMVSRDMRRIRLRIREHYGI